MNSFLDSETHREGERRPKTGSPVQSSGPNLALRDEQGFRIRPLFSAGAKGVESGVKGRQIRRPFHSDCDLLRRTISASKLRTVLNNLFKPRRHPRDPEFLCNQPGSDYFL
jgi:hypothetical protein